MPVLVQRLLAPVRPGVTLLTRLLAADANWRAAREMSRLSDHTLRDAGLSRADIRASVARSPWAAPAHWRQDR